VEVQDPFRAKHPTFATLRPVAGIRYCFCHPMPQDSALEEYNASYFASAHNVQLRNSLATVFFSGIALFRLAHIEAYLNNRDSDGSSLLEFGSGLALCVVEDMSANIQLGAANCYDI